MVAIRSNFIGAVTLLLTLFTYPLVMAQETSSYDELMTQSKLVGSQIDSLSELISAKRQQISAPSDDNATLSGEIQRLETELFDLQYRQNARIREISTLEQQGLATKFDSGEKSPSTQDETPMLSSAALLKAELPTEDLDNLKKAEQNEAMCGKIFAEYIEHYNKLRELKQLYDQTEVEEKAMEYEAQYITLATEADSLSRLLAESWYTIYDNKSFAYSMTMELIGENSLLDRQMELSQQSAIKKSKVEYSSQSEPALMYDIQKRELVTLELELAKAMNMSSAVDSLSKISTLLHSRPEVADLGEIVFEKRNFILYEPIKFVTTTPYNKSKPIPEPIVYKSGTIYRIQLGAYKYEQLPTIFKGTIPLTKDRALGFWTYYAGGFATLKEAEEAVSLLKRRGFKRPEIVRWKDGVRRNLYREPLPQDEEYRVIITGKSDLSDLTKSAINSASPNAQLSKVGADKFIISPVVGKAAADQLIESLRIADQSLKYEIITIE